MQLESAFALPQSACKLRYLGGSNGPHFSRVKQVAGGHLVCAKQTGRCSVV